jgi:pimeloyl-ACP methyl ester carboxylesterase
MIAYLNGVNIAFSDQGQGDPLIFLHAFPLNRSMWDPQVQALVKRYRIVTVDLRGHGESDAPLWRYTMEQFSDDLNALLDMPPGLGYRWAATSFLPYGENILDSLMPSY